MYLSLPYKCAKNKTVVITSFSRKFLEGNSIAKVISTGHAPKDEDWIVKLVLKGSHGRLRVSRGNQEVTVFDCPTRMNIG